MEEADYHAATRDPDWSYDTLKAANERAMNAAKRADAAVKAVKELACFYVPASDLAAFIKRQHRATQADMVESVVKMIEAFASFSDEETDLRNASAIEQCRMMARAIGRKA